MKCRHYACRCRRAAELSAQADAPGISRELSGRLAYEATQVHQQEVECLVTPALAARLGEDWDANLRKFNGQNVTETSPETKPVQASAQPADLSLMAASAHTDDGLAAFLRWNCQQCD